MTIVVLNNRSYNNERNRIWSFIGGEQFKSGKDYTCYNGSPDVDFAKALCEKINADCTIIKQDWDGMIPGLMAKKYDLIVASMGILPEREEKIDYGVIDVGADGQFLDYREKPTIPYYVSMGINVLSRIPPQMIPGKQIDISPAVAAWVENVFGARVAAAAARWQRAADARPTVPVRELEPGVFIAGLSNGPTLAFKDVAMQLLGNLFEHALAKNNAELNILGATSGDTGSAAEYAMRGKRGIRVFMLSPHGKMSAFQTAQMFSLLDDNIYNREGDAFWVKGESTADLLLRAPIDIETTAPVTPNRSLRIGMLLSKSVRKTL